MSDITNITKKITEMRKAQGLSQKALAAKLGIKQSQISDIETGKRDIRLSTLIEVARAVGLEFVLIPRSTLPTVLYLTQPVDVPYQEEQHSMYESWNEEDVELA